MTSNIQFVSELAGSIPVASAPGKVRLFRDVADGLLKFKDNLGAVYPIAGTQDYKDAVRAASAAVLPAYSRLGNIITATANGALPPQDGVSFVTNDSLLYVNGLGSPLARDNGIYVVTDPGSGGSPFILTRREDFSASGQISPGCIIPTGPEGTTNGSKLFILATADPIVLNTSLLVFESISGGGGGGLAIVRAASVTTLPAYTRTLNVITATANGVLPAQDGVTLAVDDVFLYQNGPLTVGAPNASDNGVYTVTAVGSGAAPFVLTRHPSFADSAQIQPGSVLSSGPEGTFNGTKLFALTTPGPITLNTTHLLFRCIADSFSFSIITGSRTIPVNQSMVVMDDVVIVDGGDLLVEGDLVSARTEDNDAIRSIPYGSERVVQQNEVMFYTDLVVDGTLTVDGDIEDISPIPPPPPPPADPRLPQLGDTTLTGTVQTVNATPTTIATYATLANNRVIAMKVTVIGIDPSNPARAHFVAEVTILRDPGGTVSVLEDLLIKNYKDNVNWDIQFNVAGQSVTVDVVGDVAQTVEWRVFGGVSEHG